MHIFFGQMICKKNIFRTGIAASIAITTTPDIAGFVEVQ
jgi:hypothetical protein